MNMQARSGSWSFVKNRSSCHDVTILTMTSPILLWHLSFCSYKTAEQFVKTILVTLLGKKPVCIMHTSRQHSYSGYRLAVNLDVAQAHVWSQDSWTNREPTALSVMPSVTHLTYTSPATLNPAQRNVTTSSLSRIGLAHQPHRPHTSHPNVLCQLRDGNDLTWTGSTTSHQQSQLTLSWLCHGSLPIRYNWFFLTTLWHGELRSCVRSAAEIALCCD